eukprot:12399916-Karenia_brevis.AAC.1
MALSFCTLPTVQSTPFSSMLRGMRSFMGEVTSLGEIVNFANKLQGANQNPNPNPGQPGPCQPPTQNGPEVGK